MNIAKIDLKTLKLPHCRNYQTLRPADLDLTQCLLHGFCLVMQVFMSLFIMLFLFQPKAFSMLYSGVITKSSSNHYRIKESRINKSYDLIFTDPNIEIMLSKLKLNDYITFEGARSSTTNKIRVNSINYVGLKDLLGIWQGDDTYCYNFTSFTELWIYFRTSPECAVRPTDGRVYAYTINPSDPDWVILLSDNKANYIGDVIVINQKSVKFSLYDSNTGNILRHINLKR